MIYMIPDDCVGFPDPRGGDPCGLFAVGGSLSVKQLSIAYSNGIFPWYSFRNEPLIQWYCPMTRFVIDPNKVHVSHSMRTLINKGVYGWTFDKQFDEVIEWCSKVDGRYLEDGAWLGPELISAFKELHKIGLAHSVEIYEGQELIGGLYGVGVSNCFVGDSMFSLKPNGSKLALIALSQFARQRGIKMIDCQLKTSHLKSMGGGSITYEKYMEVIHGEVDTYELF